MMRSLFAAVAIALGLVSLAGVTSACGGDVDAPIVDDSFLTVTDCAELEMLISVEVDIVNSTSNRDLIDAATERYERIVAHRDTIC